MNTNRLFQWTAVTASTTVFTLYCSESQAFFPPLPIASNPPITITDPPATSPILVNPITLEPIQIPPINPVVIPPVVPPPFVPPVVPPNVPQVNPPTCTCPPNPQNVPEPTTIVGAALGLASLVVARKRFGKVK